MTGHSSSEVVGCRRVQASRVRFERVPEELPLTPQRPCEVASYGAVERATPTQQVSGWISRTTSIDLMPSLRTLLKRSRSRGEMGNRGSTGTVSDLLGPSLPMKRDGSCTSLAPPVEHGRELAIRKCETAIALSSLAVIRSASSSSKLSAAPSRSLLRAASSRNMLLAEGQALLEPMKPVNRLRVPASSRMCSRCNSLLSMASSRYSLNVDPTVEKNASTVLCKLCLVDVPFKDVFEIQDCRCIFCKECMKSYVEFEIQEGAYDISCPDAQCEKQGEISITEIESLVMKEMVEKHNKFRLNREVDLDVSRTWCPRAGCETVCDVCPMEKCVPQSVHCPTCDTDFCSNCKNPWHLGVSCDENTKQLAKEGRTEFDGIPFDNDVIKCCPMCNVPIEKDAGCAQMMCKRCKHVFCWYCLASLDDDFLLRHYDKGPCKNKLGHSRASVIWHRTQVIGIFAGFGILLLVASPLLLLAAPCIVCCKCRVCSNKLDEDMEESVASGTAS